MYVIQHLVPTRALSKPDRHLPDVAYGCFIFCVVKPNVFERRQKYFQE